VEKFNQEAPNNTFNACYGPDHSGWATWDPPSRPALLILLLCAGNIFLDENLRPPPSLPLEPPTLTRPGPQEL
jgi:hypothetical protein